MNSGIYTAYSGLKAQMETLDTLANNLANVNTTGFKEQRAFYRLLDASGEMPGTQSLQNAVNQHVSLEGAALNLEDGSLAASGRDLDLALVGPGFLAVQTPGGVRYTRDGNLQANRQAQLVTTGGYQVLGERGPITLPPGSLDISERGEVFVNHQFLDRLKLVSFDNTSDLTREGRSLFAARPGAQEPKPAQSVSVHQRFLEQSNVSPVLSTVRMVEIMRHFEAIQKGLNLISNVMDSKSIEKLSR